MPNTHVTIYTAYSPCKYVVLISNLFYNFHVNVGVEILSIGRY